MKYIILLKLIICLLLSCLSKKNSNEENKDTHVKQSRIRNNKKNSGSIKKKHKKYLDSQLGSINVKGDKKKVNYNKFSTKIADKNIDAGGNWLRRNIHRHIHINFRHVFHKVEHAAKVVKKKLHKIAKKADVVVEAVEKVSKKITKVVDDFRRILDKFTRFAESTSLAMAIDACFESFELPITLEEFDEAVDGVDEALHLLNKGLEGTDLVLKLIVKATSSNPTSSFLNKSHIENLQNKMKMSTKALIKDKQPKAIIKKKFKKYKRKIKALKADISKIKKTKGKHPHFFRLINKREDILLETSEIMKYQNDKDNVGKILKSISEELEKNINLYKKISGIFDREKEGHQESNELFITTCALLPPNKDIHEITEEEINKGIMHDEKLINGDKIEKVKSNIEECCFLKNSKNIQETLENVIRDGFCSSFSAHQQGTFMTYFKNKEYKGLLDFVKNEIHNYDQEIKKKIDYILIREIIEQLFKKENEALKKAEIDKVYGKANTFHLNMKYLFNKKHRLEYAVNKEFNTISLFSGNEIPVCLGYLKAKKYNNLLDIVSTKISKCHEKKIKKEHFLLIQKIVKKLVETEDRDTKEIQNSITKISELCEECIKSGEKLTKTLDAHKVKLEDELRNQHSSVDSNTEEIIIERKTGSVN